MERAQKREALIEMLLDLFGSYAPVLSTDDQGNVVAIQVTIPVDNPTKKIDDAVDDRYADVGS